MCGGSIEVVPCSHVGHVFRLHRTHKFATGSNTHKNYLRVAEVWMDEYKDHVYEKIGYLRNKEAVVCCLVWLVSSVYNLSIKIAQLCVPEICECKYHVYEKIGYLRNKEAAVCSLVWLFSSVHNLSIKIAQLCVSKICDWSETDRM